MSDMATHPATPATARPTPSDVAATARSKAPVAVTGAQSLILSLEALEIGRAHV